MKFQTMFLSLLALVAFAGNSVLCRLALADGSVDPAAFTAIRITAGALSLIIIIICKHALSTNTQKVKTLIHNGWRAPVMLFSYAVLFSFAYVSLDTGTGALILFGSVQICLLVVGLMRGSRFSSTEIIGLLLASSGLVYLVFPELSKPSLIGFLMMALAGIAWGLYTLEGQGSEQPLFDTGSNFIKAVPMCLLILILFYSSLSVTGFGLIMAIASGAVTSGLGYTIWYAVLPRLSTSQAGVMQLLVPIIAAVGGVIFAGEVISSQLVVASALTLGGVLLVILAKKKRHTQ